VLFVANDGPRTAADHAIETLCHAVPGRWHQVSVVLSATSCLSRLAARLKRSQRSDLRAVLDGCGSPRSDARIRAGLSGWRISMMTSR
jgi:xylulokinase